MPGVPETFFALWGAEIAAVANPVNYFLNASQIAGIMKEAGAKALIAADPSLFPDIWPKVEEIRAAMPGLKVFRVGGKGPPPEGVIDFEAALDRQPGDRLLSPKPLERDTRRRAVPHRRHDGTAEARTPHPRRAGAGRLDQHADVRSRARHGDDQPAAAVPCRRLDRRRAVADRQRLDGACSRRRSARAIPTWCATGGASSSATR